MQLKRGFKTSEVKAKAIEDFRNHVSRGKVEFFRKYGMEFVMGARDGCYLEDLDGGKRLFNLHCNGGVFNLGHRNQELIQVLAEAFKQYDIGNSHLISKGRADLASLLAELMPADLDYVIFGVSGGEAVDVALKIARGYTRRHKIISAKGGYHGHTGLAVAAGDEKYRAPFALSIPGFVQVPFGSVEALEAEMDEDTAAVILETIPATLGIVLPPEGYLKNVRRLCTERGALLIIDEVQTGFGRTGKLWGFEHFDILPDIVVLGKGLSGGIYPITATVIRTPLESLFHDDPFIHVSTFGGAEVGCLVAKRVLEICSTPSFLDHVNELADAFKEGILKLKEKHPNFLVGLRQLGLMMGLELRDNLSGPVLSKTAYDHDLLMVYANNDPSVCQLLPPLIMNLKDVDNVMGRLDKAIGSAKRLRPLLKIKRQVEDFVEKFKGTKRQGSRRDESK
ncbi:MAG: aspartate aminotransferase family protein [Deltaproteobacteria bacterium]|nr:MAG: aspartate aminotransferase family protein [Deltaproteobacteria bacterium]